MILDQNGNLVPFSRNDAGSEQLTPVRVCKNSVIAIDSGSNQNVYFVDLGTKEIRLLMRLPTAGGGVSLINKNFEPVGAYFLVGTEFFGLVFCDGSYVALSDIVNTVRSSQQWNVIFAYRGTNTKHIYFVAYPSSLQAQNIRENPTGQLKKVSVEDATTNEFSPLLFADNQNRYAIIPEVDNTDNGVVAFLIVDLQTGAYSKEVLQSKITFGSNQPFNTRTAVYKDGKVYFALGRTGLNNANVHYYSYDGNTLTHYGAFNSDTLSGGSAQFDEVELDADGNLYMRIGNNIYSSAKSSSTATATFGALTTAFGHGANDLMHRLLDAVLVNDGGTFKILQAGQTSATNVPAGTPQDVMNMCNTLGAQYLNELSGYGTCFHRSQGSNEIAFFGSSDTSTWKLVNPDNTDVNANLTNNIRFTKPDGDVYVYADGITTGDINIYKCTWGQQNCTALTNVKAPDIINGNISFQLPPQIGNYAGMLARVDISSDEVKYFDMTVTNNMSGFSTNWDLTRIAGLEIDKLSNSICDDDRASLFDFVYTDDVNSQGFAKNKVSSDYDPNVFPPPTNLRCANNILGVF